MLFTLTHVPYTACSVSLLDERAFTRSSYVSLVRARLQYMTAEPTTKDSDDACIHAD
jgi:hypothetical protein